MQPHMQAVRRRQPHAEVGGEGVTSKSKDTLARNGLTTTTTLDNNGAAKEESCERTDNEEEILRGKKTEKGKKKSHVAHLSLRVLEEQTYCYRDTNAAHKTMTSNKRPNGTKENTQKHANSEAEFFLWIAFLGGIFKKLSPNNLVAREINKKNIFFNIMWNRKLEVKVWRKRNRQYSWNNTGHNIGPN